MGLPAGPAGREAQPIPGQPVGVTMAVEEVRLAGSFEDVGMGVELAEKVRRAAACGADDGGEFRQQVSAASELAAQAARLAASDGTVFEHAADMSSGGHGLSMAACRPRTLAMLPAWTWVLKRCAPSATTCATCSRPCAATLSWPCAASRRKTPHERTWRTASWSRQRSSSSSISSMV